MLVVRKTLCGRLGFCTTSSWNSVGVGILRNSKLSWVGKILRFFVEAGGRLEGNNPGLDNSDFECGCQGYHPQLFLHRVPCVEVESSDFDSKRDGTVVRPTCRYSFVHSPLLWCRFFSCFRRWTVGGFPSRGCRDCLVFVNSLS